MTPHLTGRATRGPWRASFAWSRERGGPGLAVRRFRRSFNLRRVPATFVCRVTADSRYVLWVNGSLAARGPARGTPSGYVYETLELAPLLRCGRNVLVAEVRHFGIHAPVGEVHTPVPGFLFEARDRPELDTPGRWQVVADGAVEPDTRPYGNALVFLGHLDRVDGRRLPRGWKTGSGQGWSPCVATAPAERGGAWGVTHLRRLVPRDIPAMRETSRRFTRTIEAMRPAPHRFGEAPRGWSVPAGRGAELVLDAGGITTAYPVLEFSGGRGRTVEVIYGESVVKPGAAPWSTREKGVRDDLAGGIVDGYRDTITLPGGRFVYEPFHWRTFWFLRIVVGPGREPVGLRDASFRESGYPLDRRARFASSDPDAARMWDVSWRTLRACAHELYVDCPYYEQLMYVGDTRLEAWTTLVLTGDPALPRRAISQFRDSARPDGLLHARWPSTEPQVIPYFALVWILMLDDFWTWNGMSEREFVRSCLGVADGILRWYRDRLRPDGFVGKAPGWNMVDDCPGWAGGEPPAVTAGGSTYLTGLYACALDAVVRLHEQAGSPEDAIRWRPVAGRTRRSLRGAWSDREGLFLEGPGRRGDHLSQHAQVLAILAGATDPEQNRRILSRLTSDPILHRMKFMQSFYLARALESAGGYDAFHGHVLEPWREMLRAHLSTWAEYPDPCRSDTHAWSAWIAADFIACGLGVRPAAPGFDGILLRPLPGGLQRAQGAAPTPRGIVEVAWERIAPNRLALTARTPAGIPVTVQLPSGLRRRFPRGGRIALSG